MEHAPNWRKRRQRRPLVRLREDAGAGSPAACRGSWSCRENSIKDIHDDMGVDIDRMRLVPVGVDPELFRPLPDDRTRARAPDHHRVGRRRPQGPRVPARGLAKLRTERDVTLTVIGRPKPGGAPRRRSSSASACADAVAVRLAGCSDERIVELYAEAELAVVPVALRRVLAARRRGHGHRHRASSPPPAARSPEVTGRDGDTVLSCPPGDSEALAAAIRRGLSDADLRDRVGAQRPGARVVERWTWRHTAVEHRRAIP